MKCPWRNKCQTPNRCCNFCENQKCWRRCKDDHKNCKYFIDEKDEEDIDVN